MPYSGKFVIELHDLSRSFAKVEVLRGVHLQVPCHSILGLLVLNGAGKTTLMKILLGLCCLSTEMGTIFGMTS